MPQEPPVLVFGDRVSYWALETCSLSWAVSPGASQSHSLPLEILLSRNSKF